jgi:hypothetical protein
MGSPLMVDAYLIPLPGRIRQGRREAKNLYWQTGPEPTDYDQLIGQVQEVWVADLIVGLFTEPLRADGSEPR